MLAGQSSIPSIQILQQFLKLLYLGRLPVIMWLAPAPAPLLPLPHLQRLWALIIIDVPVPASMTSTTPIHISAIPVTANPATTKTMASRIKPQGNTTESSLYILNVLDLWALPQIDMKDGK